MSTLILHHLHAIVKENEAPAHLLKLHEEAASESEARTAVVQLKGKA